MDNRVLLYFRFARSKCKSKLSHFSLAAENKKIVLILISSLLIVIGIELYNLTAVSLWHDEAFSALLIQYDFKEMMHRISLDVHPPFYYIVLKGWNFFFGNSLFSLRFFSVFFGVLAILSVYFLVKEAFKNKKLALLSSVLLAFNSFQIQYVMEARMYSLALFLIILSSYLLIKSLKSQKLIWWFLYALAVIAGIYTHYFFFFLVASQGIFFLYWIIKNSQFNFLEFFTPLEITKTRKKHKILKSLTGFKLGLGAYLAVIFSYLPWLRIFLNQLNQVQESYWIPKMSIWSVPNTFAKMTIGEEIDSSKFWYILSGIVVIAIIAFIYALKKIESSYKWLIFLLLIIPFSAVIVLSIKTSIYMDRYFILCLPFYIILIGGAILKIENKSVKNILIGIVILGSLISFPIYWINLNVKEKPGIAEATNYLKQEIKPNDKIFVGSSLIYFNFKYYNQTGIHPLLYAPGPLEHFSGTALLSSEDIIKNFSHPTKKDDIVWIINTTGFGNYQPQVPENWAKLKEKNFQEVYDYRGWIIVTKYQVN